MKRYLLFTGVYYYPCGGAEDYHSCYDTIEELKIKMDQINNKNVWFNVLDTLSGKMLKEKDI